jgi:cysteine-S-conjugate beta-lyase
MREGPSAAGPDRTGQHLGRRHRLQAFDLGIDISMQALTKYPSGGADVLMGSVVTRDMPCTTQLLMCHMRLGLGCQRQRHRAGAARAGLDGAALPGAGRGHPELACWMQDQPGVAAVLHPALPGSPGHEAWRATPVPPPACSARCSMSGFRRPRSTPSATACAVPLGWSWAGPISLCAPYNVPAIRTRPWPHRGAGAVCHRAGKRR